MSDFDFTPVMTPDPKTPVSFNELFASMNDIADEKPPFIGCFYSPPGAGKSTAALELLQRIVPQDQKILYVYTAQNWASIQNFPELKRRVKAIQFTKWEQLEAISDLINNEAMMEKTKIGGIVFDEFNTMVEVVLDSLTQHRAATFNAGKKQYTKQGQEMFKDPHTPEWPEYGSVKTRIVEVMTAITSANIHAVFTAHTRLQKKRTQWEPDIYDTGAQAFMRALHSLYFIDVDDNESGSIKRKFLLEPAGNRTAKNRIGKMGRTANTVKEIADAYHAWGDWGDQGMLADMGEFKPKAIESPIEAPVAEPEKEKNSVPQREQEEEKPSIDLDNLFG